MGNGGEFELSQEVLSVLPSDPYEQLEIARRITAMAVATRMSKLEAETGKLRQKLTEKEHVIHGLQERVSETEASLGETNSRLLQAGEDQNKLVNERNALAGQVKKLVGDVAKLETFKRTLMQSLQEEDDNPSGDGGDNRGGLTPNMAIWKASQAETKAQVYDDERQYSKSSSLRADSPKSDSESDGKPGLSRTSPKQILRVSSAGPARGAAPRLTPTGSPKPQPNKGSPLTSSQSLDSSQIQIPTSQPTSRSSSPPSHGSGQSRGSTRLDGKEFFRQARSRLSYEQFSSFLANIKELNAHRQTREDAGKSRGDLRYRESRPVQRL